MSAEPRGRESPPTPDSPPPAPVLEMRGIIKTFGTQRALDGVDFAVRAGEIHGLLGENGAGKSTLMNVLAGVIRPEAGSVTVAGRPLRPGSPADSAAVGVGMVHQHFALLPALTVAENLSLAAGAGPVFYRRSADLAGPALEIAERLGWRFDPDTPVWQLPVGRQQRLEILKALQCDARWLLFDEPTAVLSPPEVEELFGVLERLRQEGRAIVFISHKLGEVLRLCDRITVLRRGRKVGEVSRPAIPAELGRLMIGTDGTGETDRKTHRESVHPLRGYPGAKAREGKGREIHHAHTETRKLGDIGVSSPAASLRDHHDSLTKSLSRFRFFRVFASKRLDEACLSVAGAPALAVRDLRVRSDRGEEAVRGLSFDVQRGEIFGIAGVDGNGQAELAEAVMGLRAPTAGSVTLPQHPGSHLVGDSHTQHPLRPGYIPQDRRRAGLVSGMSVRENLALEIYAAPGFRWGPMLRLDRLWFATHGMAQRFDVRVTDERQPVETLSGGNQQKIVVARALSVERSIVVAVNPTRGLDVGATRYVHEQLRAARTAGVGVLLISAELDEVLALSDRLGVLYAGRFQGIVAPAEPRESIGQMMGGAGGMAAPA